MDVVIVVRDHDPEARERVASRADLDPVLLAELAEDPDNTVRTRARLHPLPRTGRNASPSTGSSATQPRTSALSRDAHRTADEPVRPLCRIPAPLLRRIAATCPKLPVRAGLPDLKGEVERREGTTMSTADEHDRLLRGPRTALERARRDQATWTDLAYCGVQGTGEGRLTDRNRAARFAVLWALQYDRRPQDLPLLRFLLRQQATYYREVVVSGMAPDLTLAGFLVATSPPGSTPFSAQPGSSGPII